MKWSTSSKEASDPAHNKFLQSDSPNFGKFIAMLQVNIDTMLWLTLSRTAIKYLLPIFCGHWKRSTSTQNVTSIKEKKIETHIMNAPENESEKERIKVNQECTYIHALTRQKKEKKEIPLKDTFLYSAHVNAQRMQWQRRTESYIRTCFLNWDAHQWTL